MQPSKSEGGSAVVEFVLLGLPALFVFAFGMSIFLNGYTDTVLRAVAVDASRYAALADQNPNSAKSYLESKLLSLLPSQRLTFGVERTSIARVDIEYQPIQNLINLGTVKIRAVAPIEK